MGEYADAGGPNVDIIARIDALLKRDILPNTRADLAAFKAAAIAGTLDAADERYVWQLYERLCSGAPPQSSPPQRTTWPAALDRPSPLRRMEPTTQVAGSSESTAAEWLDGFIARLFILFGLTARGSWRIAAVLCELAAVIAGIAGFATSEGSVIDRLLMGLGIWLLAAIGFGIALTVLRWLTIAAIFIVRIALVLLHWLLTGREATVSRVTIDFEHE